MLYLMEHIEPYTYVSYSIYRYSNNCGYSHYLLWCVPCDCSVLSSLQQLPLAYFNCKIEFAFTHCQATLFFFSGVRGLAVGCEWVNCTYVYRNWDLCNTFGSVKNNINI